MFRKATAVIMTIMLSFACFGSAVSASQLVPDVTPAYVNAVSASSELTITGTTAKCVSRATGISSVTSIVINQTLQKKTSSGTWQTVTHWNETDTGYVASTTNYKYSLSSGTYRLKTQFTFLTSTGFENVTAYSTEKTV